MFKYTQDLNHGIAVIFICCILIVVSVLLDLHSGIAAARANKERLRSHIFRRTITKMVDYLRIVFFGVMIDVLGLNFIWYTIPYCTIFVTLGSVLIEARSVIENSARKRSAVAELPQMLERVKAAITDKDADEIIREIKAQGNGKPHE